MKSSLTPVRIDNYKDSRQEQECENMFSLL
jgi:hypothetical protein